MSTKTITFKMKLKSIILHNVGLTSVWENSRPQALQGSDLMTLHSFHFYFRVLRCYQHPFFKFYLFSGFYDFRICFLWLYIFCHVLTRVHVLTIFFFFSCAVFSPIVFIPWELALGFGPSSHQFSPTNFHRHWISI